MDEQDEFVKYVAGGIFRYGHAQRSSDVILWFAASGAFCIGSKGIAKDLPGTNTLQPHKKTKNHKRFTKEEKEHNHAVNSARVKVEHSIGRLKRYGRLTAPYKGKIGDFNREFNIITGLVNLDLLWNQMKKGPPSGSTLGPVINWEEANVPGSAVSNN